MKSILFLIPKMNGINGLLNEMWTEDIEKAVEKGRWNVVTPSALLLASIARQEDYEIDVVDETFRKICEARFYDIVCIYTVTPNAKRAYRYAEQFRKRGMWVVLGGVHSFYMSEEAKEHCDTLLLGEGEYTFREFLEDFAQGRAKKVYDQPPGKVSLKDSAIPLYSCLSRDEQRLVPVQTARGCPHNCSFCNVRGLYGSGFRSKRKEQIEKELLEIDTHTGCKTVYITNDNIVSNQEHFHDLMDVMGKNNFFWYGNADISFGEKKESIKKAYDSGLRQVLIGFESIDGGNLYHLNKSHFKFHYVKKYREYIARIQEHGIGVVGSFIVGQVNDTEDTFHRLEEFIYESNLYGANVTMFTPYPGTELYAAMDREKKIMTYDWDYYTIFQPVIKMEAMSMEKINECYLNLLKSIHSKEATSRRIRYFSEIYKNCNR